MTEVTKVDVSSIIRLKSCRHRLTTQQYKTLRGQVFVGDSAGAMKGLRKILENFKEEQKNGMDF